MRPFCSKIHPHQVEDYGYLELVATHPLHRGEEPREVQARGSKVCSDESDYWVSFGDEYGGLILRGFALIRFAEED